MHHFFCKEIFKIIGNNPKTRVTNMNGRPCKTYIFLEWTKAIHERETMMFSPFNRESGYSPMFHSDNFMTSTNYFSFLIFPNANLENSGFEILDISKLDRYIGIMGACMILEAPFVSRHRHSPHSLYSIDNNGTS